MNYIITAYPHKNMLCSVMQFFSEVIPKKNDTI